MPIKIYKFGLFIRLERLVEQEVEERVHITTLNGCYRATAIDGKIVKLRSVRQPKAPPKLS